MRTLWVDAGNGAAGDMLLGALLDAGASLEVVRDGLARLGVEPIGISTEQVRRHGLRAAKAGVRAPESSVTRNLADVAAIVAGAGLAEEVVGFATATFERLADAEARVHGVEVSAIHFHEVGALDAIADVVGCALALSSLGLLGSVRRVVSPVAVGSGTVRAAHGELPVPVPAVLELLTRAGGPIRGHAASMELCTPTGAALLCALATEWGPAPSGTPLAVGVGAGTADPPGHPNVLRVMVGAGDAAPDWGSATMHRVDATIDDLDPRLWPDVLESLRGAGAADAWCVPALMRKGRPGQVLSVLVDTERLDAVCRMVFEQTTTLGVRISPVQRRFLRRSQVAVGVAGGVVHVKRGHLGAEIVTVQPEYDDARAVASASGLPLADVLAEARRAAAEVEHEFADDGPAGGAEEPSAARGGQAEDSPAPVSSPTTAGRPPTSST